MARRAAKAKVKPIIVQPQKAVEPQKIEEAAPATATKSEIINK